MIDTLKLSLVEYEISENPQLTLEHSPTNLETGSRTSVYRLFMAGGRVVEGLKAYHNAENFNLTIKPLSSLQPQIVGCYLQFSLPKLANGTNYYPITEQAAKRALRGLEGDLREIGVSTNLDNAVLSRVDSFRNVLASETYATYHPVLSALKGKRMAQRDYGTTFLWSNTQQELCVYDKLAEMAARKHKTAGLAPNTIRFEHRLLKARKVRDTLSMATAGDLLSDLAHVETTFKANLEKQLFSKSVSDVEAFLEVELENQLRFFCERGDRFWFQSWLSAVALRGLAVDSELILSAVGKVTNHRSTQLRIKRQLEAAKMDAMQLELSANPKRTLAELYTELQSKVLG